MLVNGTKAVVSFKANGDSGLNESLAWRSRPESSAIPEPFRMYDGRTMSHDPGMHGSAVAHWAEPEMAGRERGMTRQNVPTGCRADGACKVGRRAQSGSKDGRHTAECLAPDDRSAV